MSADDVECPHIKAGLVNVQRVREPAGYQRVCILCGGSATYRRGTVPPEIAAAYRVGGVQGLADYVHHVADSAEYVSLRSRLCAYFNR